ncbi:MAG: substrate-binding domain-containing protein [Clostridiales bacterium]|nr:substrate-binding domain-containing protein [Clostridiales bacterium]
MKKILALVLALAMLLSVTAAMAGGIKVGIINNPPSESGYRAANVADFEKVFCEANGYSVQTKYAGENDDQLEAAKQFINDGVDYLLISAAETTGWEAVLKDAKEQGIGVFLFDRMIEVDPEYYEAAVVSDMASEGKNAVQWLLDQNLPEYKVVHIQGKIQSDAQIGRTAALDEQFANGKMTKVVQQAAGVWDPVEAKKIMQQVIDSGEDFNVLYSENTGMALGAVKAMDEAGITHGKDGKVIVMAFDCDIWAMEKVLAGEWNFIQQCSPFQAALIDEMIKKLQAGEAIEGLDENKKIVNPERGFDTATITEEEVKTYSWDGTAPATEAEEAPAA